MVIKKFKGDNMPKLIDLTNKRFDRLLVLERSDDYITSNGRKHVMWKCLCDCGNIINVRSENLRNGHTKSCGCLLHEHNIQMGKERKVDLTGQNFGYLTVLKESSLRSKKGEIKWICQCKCGNIIEIIGSNLTRKQEGTISCGCIHSKGELKIIQLLKELNIKYEYQKIFPNCYFPDTNRHPIFDFYLPKYNLIIEYDGEQHLHQQRTFYNTKFENINKRDLFKNKWCLNNNIPLLRIPYTDYSLLNKNSLSRVLTHYGYREI